MNDFQKQFLARGTGSTLYTQKEFDDQLSIAKAQIMQVAISTTKTAIALEREECAKIADGMELPAVAEAIRNRLVKNDKPAD